MYYFKVTKNRKVIDIGCTFLKFENNRLYVCDENEGQYLQSYDEKNIYRDSWMKAAPKSFKRYTTAKVVSIDEMEFKDLEAMLNDGEEIIEQQPIIEQPQEEIINEPSTEKPISIAEMRELIAEQQKQINTLMELISDRNALKNE